MLTITNETLKLDYYFILFLIFFSSVNVWCRTVGVVFPVSCDTLTSYFLLIIICLDVFLSEVSALQGKSSKDGMKVL